MELRELHFPSHDGTVNPQLGRSAPNCEILPIADLVFGVRIGERYLSAGVDGLVSNDRPHCQRWEHYRFLRADTVRGLSLMRRYSWLSHDDRRILCLADQPLFLERSSPWESSALAGTLAPGAIEFRRGLAFGPVRLPVVSREQVITIGQSGDGHRPPPHLEIRATPGGAYRFSRFAPLVHYRLGGDDTAYECLRLSLTSLIGHGGYLGAISIACDRPEESLLAYLPQELRSRVTFARISVADAAEDAGLDPTLQDRHQPILLAAPDVIFDASILDLLSTACWRAERGFRLRADGPSGGGCGTSRKRRRTSAGGPFRPILPR